MALLRLSRNQCHVSLVYTKLVQQLYEGKKNGLGHVSEVEIFVFFGVG